MEDLKKYIDIQIKSLKEEVKKETENAIQSNNTSVIQNKINELN